MTATYQPDHAGGARARLLEQFRSKPRIAALLDAFSRQTQHVEDALYGILRGRMLANAVGVQLDTIGKIVGQPRGNSVDDAEYRVRIRARILCNRSSGTYPDLYGIFQVLLPGVNTWVKPGYPAAFEFFLNTPVTAAYAALYAGFVFTAKAAGVGANFIWYPINDANSFMFEPTVAFISSNLASGVTNIPVVSTAGWPSSGVVVFDQGTLTEESFDIVGITPTRIVIGGTTAYGHDINTAAALQGSNGLGFGDTAFSITGGQLAGVIGA